MFLDYFNYFKEFGGYYFIFYYKFLFLKMLDLEKVKDICCRNYIVYIICIEEVICILSL